MTKAAIAVALLAIGLSACAPSAPSGPASGSGDGAPAPSRPSRTLSIIVGAEPRSLALKALGQAGVTLATSRRLFNASLVIIDDKGAVLPYLATSLPRLNTESWRIEPDGRMETTYRLR